MLLCSVVDCFCQASIYTMNICSYDVYCPKWVEWLVTKHSLHYACTTIEPLLCCMTCSQWCLLADQWWPTGCEVVVLMSTTTATHLVGQNSTLQYMMCFTICLLLCLLLQDQFEYRKFRHNLDEADWVPVSWSMPHYIQSTIVFYSPTFPHSQWKGNYWIIWLLALFSVFAKAIRCIFL